MSNYVVYHLHTEQSLLDSCTNYKMYVDLAKQNGQKAIAFTEHGNIYSWLEKKTYCDENDIKYIHGVECYLTESLEEKVRDNYHTILLAKNYEGFKEINRLIDTSTQDDHFYYKPRISFDEFLNISNNVIKISACLSSPLSRKNMVLNQDYIEKLINKYDYLEIQPHVKLEDQKEYNKYLYKISQKYNKPLIAGTDTHNANNYKSECRILLKKAKFKKSSVGDISGKYYYNYNEDDLDLTYKSYEELVSMFKNQNCLEESIYMSAIENTNKMADMVESFELDKSFKYPKLYEDDEKVLWKTLRDKYEYKVKNNIIEDSQEYWDKINEEMRVFKKVDMIGFMLFMSEMMTWCRDNNIPVGFCRGSVGGSTVAYIADITDVNPVIWGTVFSRFCNEDRAEIGDIDIDVSPDQREMVYNYIINRFGKEYTSYILASGTISDKGTIDEIVRALGMSLDDGESIKQLYSQNQDKARKKYPEVFYYFDGLLNTVISQSMHPAGMLASSVNLIENYGTFWNKGFRISCINMEEVHEVSIPKYDILGLRNIQIIRETCSLANIPYPLSHTVNWQDENVWNDITTSPVGIFQFESKFAFDSMKKFVPNKVDDLSLVNAAIRPSGTSYRDNLLKHNFNKNPSEQIDELLKDNCGFLVYQEDTIKFLQEICGLTGSDADNVRRAIGRKQKDRLEKALPKILDGYCSKSSKPRNIAEEEAKEFLQIIEDSANYQFGFNHSTGYSMIGYLCAMLRYYYPLEFITAFMNCSDTEEDISNGMELARIKRIKINNIKFKYSKDKYFIDKERNEIYKGIGSVKFLNNNVANELFELGKNNYNRFSNLVADIKKNTSCNSKQLDILIKLDFFSEFGSSQKLSMIVGISEMFKFGESKKFAIEKLEDGYIKNAVEKFSTTMNKNGKPLKQYSILDCDAIIQECEDKIIKMNVDDFTYSQKANFQQEYLGYISIVSGNEDDRTKLYIKNIYPVKRKKDGKQFGWSVIGQSIGSGKQTRYTILNKDFERCGEIIKGDIIICLHYKKNGEYFNIDNYKIILQ